MSKDEINWIIQGQLAGWVDREGWRFAGTTSLVGGEWQTLGLCTPIPGARLDVIQGVLDEHHHQVLGSPSNLEEARQLVERFLLTAPVPEERCGCGPSADSPDVPLERTIAGTTIRFDTATVTLEGILPPGFSGPVAKAAQDIFRPLQVVLEPVGQYSILLSGTRERAGVLPICLSVRETSALSVGGFVCLWLENFTDIIQPFRVRLRGHSGRPYRGSSPPMNEEVGCSSVVMGMIAAKDSRDTHEVQKARVLDASESWQREHTDDFGTLEAELLADEELKAAVEVLVAREREGKS